MPWPTYPMTLKVTSSHEEGADRKWAIATKEFVGDAAGNLKALKIVDLEWQITEDGRPAKFVEREGSEREIPYSRRYAQGPIVSGLGYQRRKRMCQESR